MRVLRNYRRVAQRQHWCDRCCTYIQPGETYQGWVHAYDDLDRLIVLKMHVEPSCDYPPDPFDEREEIHHEEIPLKLAA